MSDPLERSLKRIQKIATWVGGAGGVTAPGVAFFLDHTPPAFPQIGILLVPFLAALLLVTFYRELGRSSSGRRAVRRIAVGLAAAALYVLALAATTVGPPAEREGGRYQCGFGKFDFSLTEKGKELKRDMPNAPLQDWLLAVGGMREGGSQIIWEAWTVFAAGALLIGTFLGSAVCWTRGLGLLAAYVSKREGKGRPKTSPPRSAPGDPERLT